MRIPAPEPAVPQPQAIPLAIVYEDAHLIVIDKPKGLTVHPAPATPPARWSTPLSPTAGPSLSGIGGVKRPGIVHRLDKDTTGLLVAAKTDRAHRGLSEQFAAHGADGRLERGYRAIAWGAPERPRGVIDAPLARSSANRTKIAVVARRGAAGTPSRATECSQRFSAGGRASRLPACCALGWRPAAPIRCACTSPTSAIRCSAT